jgi:hypothetical protein
MPIAEIINEVDAYLSRLRQARELLLDGSTEPPQKTVRRRKRGVMVRWSRPASSIRRRADEKKSPSNHPVAHLKPVRKRVDPSSEATSAVAEHLSHSEQTKISEPKRTVEESVPITRLPASRQISPIRSVKHRFAKPSSGSKPGPIKPAIALAGPMNTKIVVVSAEQAQKEREQAARPPIPRPRRSASGLSGRLAFEALFEDGTKPSNPSGQ